MRLRQSLSPRVARRSIAALAIALSLAVVGRPSLHAQSGATTAPTLEPALRDTLRARIRTLLDSASVASVTVAVARDGAVLWEEGFGFADIARHVRATPATRYSIASITKPMTATAVMRLVIPTADAGRVPHLVTMQVQLRGDTLRGWAAASATAETNDYSLSSYAELTRSAAGRLVRR